MALREIIILPDKQLRLVSKPIEKVTAEIRRLADDMLETMYEADGVGLAATQVDQHICLVVIDTSDSRDRPQVLINPEIVAHSDERKRSDEGCLSVPTIYDEVERYAWVRVRALDRDGELIEFEAEGLAGVCVQHELDHLLGRVFVEYLSPLKRDRIKTKMVKKSRDEQGRRGA